jgi:hypothetical protein
MNHIYYTKEGETFESVCNQEQHIGHPQILPNDKGECTVCHKCLMKLIYITSELLLGSSPTPTVIKPPKPPRIPKNQPNLKVIK